MTFTVKIYFYSVLAEILELVTCMTTCIERVRFWMAGNHLRLNPAKTKLIWLSSPCSLGLYD